MRDPHTTINDVLHRFLERVKDLPDRARIQVFHHGDPDGACAAATFISLALKLRRSSKLSSQWIGTHQFDFEIIRNFLSSHVGYFVFFFDLNLSSQREFFRALPSLDANALAVVDDHIPNEGRPELTDLLFNPNLVDDGPAVDFAPSIFTYRAAQKLGVAIPSWLPAIGLFSDRQLALHRDLLPEPIPPDKELFEAAVTLSNFYLDPQSGNDQNTPLDHLLAHVALSSDWKAFYNSTVANAVLLQSRQRVEQSIAHDFRSMIESGPERVVHTREPLMIFKQNSQFRTTNILASRLRGRFPECVVLVYRNDQDVCFFELRAGDNLASYDIVSVLRQVSQRVALRNYGGHKRAAGGACKREVFAQVVERYGELGS